MGVHKFSPRTSPTRGDYLMRRQFSRRLRTFVVVALLICCFYIMASSANIVPNLYPQQRRECSHDAATTFNKSNTSNILPTGGRPGVKVGKVSMLYGNPSPHYVRALHSHEVHAEQHGYPMFVLKTELIDGIWSKPAYLMQLVMQEMQKPVEERLEWLFWADADTYVVNPLVPLESFLPPPSLGHISMLHGEDHNGLNFGVFFIRISPWTLRFMSDVLAMRHYQPNQKLRFEEQSAVAHLLNTTQMYSSARAITPQRWFNAYMGPRHWDGTMREGGTTKSNSVIEGDLLIHFAGHSNQKKTRMTQFMNKQEELKDVWQIPYEETRYPREITKFWRKFATLTDAQHEEAAKKEKEKKIKEVVKDKQESKEHDEAEKEDQTTSDEVTEAVTTEGEQTEVKSDSPEVEIEKTPIQSEEIEEHSSKDSESDSDEQIAIQNQSTGDSDADGV